MNILYAEDSNEKYMSVMMALKPEKTINIKRVSSVFDAIDAIKNTDEPFDAILTDMRYPLSNVGDVDDEAGIELIHRLKEENVDIPVIVLSSVNYKIDEAHKTLWYSNLNPWDKELISVLKNIAYPVGDSDRPAG